MFSKLKVIFYTANENFLCQQCQEEICDLFLYLKIYILNGEVPENQHFLVKCFGFDK